MQRSESTRRLANVSSLFLSGILAGIVVAAAAFPLVGSVGLSAKAASDGFVELPSDLKAGPPPLTSTLMAADGTRITSFYEENRVDVPLRQMAKVMQDAIIAAEDRKFWVHSGTDPKAVFRAMIANVVSDGSGTQGGSTLTQQYVKQALYYSAKTKEERLAAIAPTGGRKIQEMRFAVALEKKLTKEQILERYLNIANFGNNTYGVAAAAQAYFAKPASKLSLADAALLASIVKNPVKYDPIRGDKESAKARRDYVINEMRRLNMVDDKQVAAAKKEPIPNKRRTTPRKCENGKIEYGFYCGWFLDWWRDQPQFGATGDEREANLFKGGYKITTALDPKMQKAAQEAVDRKLPRDHRLANGVVLIEPGTGRVKAMAVNRTYGLKKPATTNPLLSGNAQIRGYPAGSTFKMFTMVAALEKGMPLNTSIHSPPRYTSQYYGGDEGCEKWCPKNASPAMTGNQTMWSAFGESANTYFVQLEEMVTVKAAIQAGEKLGLRLRTDDDLKRRKEAFADEKAWGSFTLGVVDATPLDMANAYATIAARGKYCAPLPLLKVLDHENKPLPYANPSCKQVIRPEVADAAADAARCPVGGDAAGPCNHPGGRVTVGRVADNIRRPVAGKSGTTSNDKGGTPTAWFVGFTPNLAAASFIVNPETPSADDVARYGTTPGTIFIDTMRQALKRLPEKDFVEPPEVLTYGVRVTVPDVNGETVESAKEQLRAAGFNFRVEEKREGSRYDEGLVARTDPWGGTSSTKGGVVTIYVSGGSNGWNRRDDDDQGRRPDVPNDRRPEGERGNSGPG